MSDSKYKFYAAQFGKFHGLSCQICRIRLFQALGFDDDYIEQHGMLA